MCAASLGTAAQPVPADTVPFSLGADRRIYVEVRLNNDTTPLRFLLDTGATDVVLNSRSPRAAGLARFDAAAQNFGANSSVRTGVQASAEMDGVMGNNLLQRFDQVYDFRRGWLYLTVNDRFYSPFYDFLLN